MTVTSDGTGVEWSSARGGNSNGIPIGVEWTLIDQIFTIAAVTTSQSFNLSDANKELCRNSHFFTVSISNASDGSNSADTFPNGIGLINLPSDKGTMSYRWFPKAGSTGSLSDITDVRISRVNTTIDGASTPTCSNIFFRKLNASDTSDVYAYVKFGKVVGKINVPSIPKPVGAKKFLRVDAAGSAYELVKDWPDAFQSRDDENDLYVSYQKRSGERSSIQPYELLETVLFGLNDEIGTEDRGSFIRVNSRLDSGGHPYPQGSKHFTLANPAYVSTEKRYIGRIALSATKGALNTAGWTFPRNTSSRSGSRRGVAISVTSDFWHEYLGDPPDLPNGDKVFPKRKEFACHWRFGGTNPTGISMSTVSSTTDAIQWSQTFSTDPASYLLDADPTAVGVEGLILSCSIERWATTDGDTITKGVTLRINANKDIPFGIGGSDANAQHGRGVPDTRTLRVEFTVRKIQGFLAPVQKTH